MRLKTWRVFLSDLLRASSASMVHAGNNVWTSIGPEGGVISALAIDPTTPTTLYAGTDGGGVFATPLAPEAVHHWLCSSISRVFGGGKRSS